MLTHALNLNRSIGAWSVFVLDRWVHGIDLEI